MYRQIFLLSIGCIILSLLGLTNAEDDISEEIKKRKQLYEDVGELKKSVSLLLTDAEVLKKGSERQLERLKDIQFNVDDQDDKENVCSRISGFFNSTYRKYNMFEERIVTKLDEIQEEQTTNLNKILVRQNLSKNCQQGSALDIMSEALSEMNEKIDKFEKQLDAFETLEQKLIAQEATYQALNDAQMNILKEINEKLTQNQLKYDNFEKQIPNLQEINEKVGKMSQPSKGRLPMEIILGMTQNQGKPADA